MRRSLRTVTLGVTVVALALTTATTAGNASATRQHSKHHGSGGPVVVADHLNNPRQLAVGPGGTLYVAQAGSGGTTCTGTGEEQQCTGDTAAIAKIRRPWSAHPSVRTVIGNLPSSAGPDGSFAIGANGVGVSKSGKVYGLVSGSPDTGTPTGDVVNTLFRVKHGQAKVIVNLADYENANDPDGQGPDSDAYSLLVQRNRILVADAAGNDIVSVDRWGHPSTFHVFPNITTGACAGQPNDAGTTGCDFVPTSLANGPHGTILVTGLASETPNEGRVVQLSRNGKFLHAWSGFTAPVSVVASGRGFFVSELLANLDEANPDPPNTGLVTKVSWNGHRSSRVVPLPAGLAIIGKYLYVSAYSVAPASGLFGNPSWNGQIWRLKL